MVLGRTQGAVRVPDRRKADKLARFHRLLLSCRRVTWPSFSHKISLLLDFAPGALALPGAPYHVPGPTRGRQGKQASHHSASHKTNLTDPPMHHTRNQLLAAA